MLWNSGNQGFHYKLKCLFFDFSKISPGCSLEGLMLKLKIQYVGIWCRELTHLKRPWCWERLRAGGEGDHRWWDGSMASLTQWTWVWVDSGSWSWTGRPGVLWFMGSQRVGHDWATELNWTIIKTGKLYFHEMFPLKNKTLLIDTIISETHCSCHPFISSSKSERGDKQHLSQHEWFQISVLWREGKHL